MGGQYVHRFATADRPQCSDHHMALVTVVLQLIAVMVVLVVGISVLVLHKSNIRRLRSEFVTRLRHGLPGVLVLGVVLLLNALFRTAAEDLSWYIGFNVTGMIYRIEGHTVHTVQTVLGPAMTGFFSFMYIYGYILLLIFPLIAYLTMRKLDVFRELTIAYTANYLIGLICYIIFIAYGPRNLIPEVVGAPLYTEYPQFRLLTAEFNQHTNVFPSLHASLSGTVALFAWRTRDTFPVWVPVAFFMAGSVMVATMYLAIHWLIDVLAGIGLAIVSTWIGIRVHEREYLQKFETRLEAAVDALANRS